MTHRQGILPEMSQTGVSRFEVFYGESGVGKTTFFFETVGIHSIEGNAPLATVTTRLPPYDAEAVTPNTITDLKDRDIPTQPDDARLKFFDDGRVRFRRRKQRHLVVWPLPPRVRGLPCRCW